MKEATGDLNMTVVVVLLVAGMVAFFSMSIWPTIKSGVKNEGNCSDAVCTRAGCEAADYLNSGVCNCTFKQKDGTEIPISCPYKG